MVRITLSVLALFVFSALPLATDLDRRSRSEDLNDFTFVRLIYRGSDFRGINHWATDYPKADEQFVYAVRRLTDFNFVNPNIKAIPILSEELFEYPFAYAVEVGYMHINEEEALFLREYLLRGGFLMVDDFHGEAEWQNFYRQIKKVLPEYEPRRLSVDHPIFQCYFNIDRLIQVPGLQYLYTGRTWEKGGTEARYMGIEDENGRILVMINHNVDLGDAWEWAEVEQYPREFINLAFQLGVNYVVYAMTH